MKLIWNLYMCKLQSPSKLKFKFYDHPNTLKYASPFNVKRKIKIWTIWLRSKEQTRRSYKWCNLQLIWSRSKEQTRRSCKPGEIMALWKPWLNVLSNDRKKIFIQLWWDKTENNQNYKIFVIKTARTLRQITKTLQNFIKL